MPQRIPSETVETIADYYCWTQPPTFYSWDAHQTGGVTDDPAFAAAHVKAALVAAPDGAEGVIRRVRLSGRVFAAYEDLGAIAHAWREDGAVLWEEAAR